MRFCKSFWIVSLAGRKRNHPPKGYAPAAGMLYAGVRVSLTSASLSRIVHKTIPVDKGVSSAYFSPQSATGSMYQVTEENKNF
jgi:hypothetical protein